MSTGFESQSGLVAKQQAEVHVSDMLLEYLIMSMPAMNNEISISQLAEDMGETLETTLAALHCIQADRIAQFSFDNDTVTVLNRDDDFIEGYTFLRDTFKHRKY